MKTTEIRREYIAPRLIPRAYKQPSEMRDKFAIRFELDTFDVGEIAPELLDTLFVRIDVDALVLTRRRFLTRAERDEIKATTGYTRITGGPTYYRVIAYKGKAFTGEEYTDRADALRDAVTRCEHPARETDKNE